MSDYVFIATIVAMIGVVAALAYGLFNFARLGDDARRRSQMAMRWRVGLQFAAVLLILGLVTLLGGR